MNQPNITLPLIITALAALAAIIALAVTAWIVVGNLNSQTQDGDHVEVLAAASALSQSAGKLAATSGEASNARMTRDSIIASMASLADDKAELTQQLASLQGKGYDAHVSRISEHINLLVSNSDKIEEGRPNLLRAMLAGEQSRQQLGLATTRRLVPALAGSLDDQFYYMATGRSDARPATAGAGALTEEEFIRYTHLSELIRSVGLAHSFLSIAARMADPTLVTNVEEAFDSSAQRMERSIEYLAANGGPDVDPTVIPLSRQLIEAGAGQGNYFDALRLRLGMAVTEQQLIAANERVLDNLQAEIDALVQAVGTGYAASQQDSDQAASTGTTLVLIFAILGVVLTLLGTGYLLTRSRRPAS